MMSAETNGVIDVLAGMEVARNQTRFPITA
jgi:hypothetical protein